MPLYEYECRECEHQFEALILPKTTARCPECQGQDLERMLSMFAVSSENTRQANLKKARKKAAVIKKDKDHEQHKYEHRIMKEESGG
jgi:putative FmdB family regulatory protein